MSDAERDFARCSQLWAAARGFRTFRTAQQDAAARTPFARLAAALRRGGEVR